MFVKCVAPSFLYPNQKYFIDPRGAEICLVTVAHVAKQVINKIINNIIKRKQTF